MSTFYGHKPRIYAENADTFTHNGLGFLPDAQSCKVTEKLNGGLELEMQYPISGAGYEHIKINGIIYTPINPYDNWQPFRIYNISRPTNGIVRVNAEHKSYELSGYPCLPNDDYLEVDCSAATFMNFLQYQAARTATALSIPAYTFETDIQTSARWSIESPTDIWSVMALAAKWYNGEWKYNGTTCRLCAQRGENRGVKVQYGSNLSTITQDEVDTSYTHIMPYWTDGTTTVYINGYYMLASYTEARMQKRVLILDMSKDFEAAPTAQELYDAADAWSDENPPKGIEKNQKVTFVSRGQTVEYASLGDIDHVELGDTIDISSNPLNISGTLRCITLVYDVLRGVYSTAELGVTKSSLATATVTATEKAGATVWVSTAEPTEGYKSGDYWIKIDNNVTRVAQALGRYTGGNWLLLCEYGGGTGEFLDSGHTSVAHNDTEHNVSGGLYDNVDGYKNTIGCQSSSVSQEDVVINGANTVCGQHNLLGNCASMFVCGQGNTVLNSHHSIVSGNDHTLNTSTSYSASASYSVIGGESVKSSGSVQHSLICGDNTYITTVNRSVIVGELYKDKQTSGGTTTYTPADNIYTCVIVAENTKITGQTSQCVISGENNNSGGARNTIISGSSNKVNNGTYDNIVTGHENKAVIGHNQIISGQNNTIGGNNSCIVGMDHQFNVNNALVCGTGGENEPGNYVIIVGGGSSNVFTVDSTGNVNAARAITPGADYAEYFEWLDGNSDNEDRRGMLVSLVGDKIQLAHGDEFIGIISVNPSMAGNAAELHWHGKYKKDVFGCTMKDEAGKPIISDDYKKQKYIPRSERVEWALVGLVGRLVIVDDGSCKVGNYVSARRGKGTNCYARTNARVLRRIDDNHVEVLVR